MGKPIVLMFDPDTGQSIGVKGQQEKLEKFILNNFGSKDKVSEVYIKSKYTDSEILKVFIFEPTDSRPYYTLVTAGVSYVPMNHEDQLFFREFVMCLPPDTKKVNWHLNIMYSIMQYVRAYDAYVDVGHTFENVQYKRDNRKDKLDGKYVYITRLSLYDPNLTCHINNDVEISFLAVIPIYKNELKFITKTQQSSFQTLESVASLMKFKGLTELVDENRRSLITTPREIKKILDKHGNVVFEKVAWLSSEKQELDRQLFKRALHDMEEKYGKLTYVISVEDYEMQQLTFKGRHDEKDIILKLCPVDYSEAFGDQGSKCTTRVISELKYGNVNNMEFTFCDRDIGSLEVREYYYENGRYTFDDIVYR